MEQFIAVHAHDLFARHLLARSFVRHQNPAGLVHDHHEVLDGIECALPLLLGGPGFVDGLLQFCGLVNHEPFLNRQQLVQRRHLSLQNRRLVGNLADGHELLLHRGTVADASAEGTPADEAQEGDADAQRQRLDPCPTWDSLARHCAYIGRAGAVRRKKESE